MAFTIFDRLSAYLQKSQKPHPLYLVFDYGRLVDEKVPEPHHAKVFLKILPMAISINWPSFMTK